MSDDFMPGDRVIWRYDGDEWTIEQIRDNHPRPIWLVHKMFGDGPKEFGHARLSDVIRISR